MTHAAIVPTFGPLSDLKTSSDWLNSAMLAYLKMESLGSNDLDDTS